MRSSLRSRKAAAEAPLVNAACGRPLDRGVRTLMESRFKADFRTVRLHSGGEAARAAAAVSAAAFTAGPHIVFGAEQPRLDGQRGQRLLAHELAHVVQQRRGVADPVAVSRTDDTDERAAARATDRIASGEPPEPLPAAQAGIQRQALADPSLTSPRVPIVQSQAATVTESFLGTMWERQSDQKRPLRITPTLRQGLQLIFPMGPPLTAITDYASAHKLLEQLRPSLPTTIAPDVQRVLDSLAAHEPALPAIGFKPDADPATPTFPDPAHALPAAPPDPRKPPEQGKGADDAAMKALAAAAEMFRKTELGKQLEKRGKDYVLSKRGIPLVAIVAAGVVTFVAANDPSLPSSPDLPLADGISLKVDISGKASDLPPLLRDLAHGQSEPAAPERKVAVSATFTFEAFADFVRDAGHFFAAAGRAIEHGVVKAGTVIGHAVKGVLTEVLAAAGGAAIGAGIGALAGGGIGALIGAGIGAGIGLGTALIKRLVERKGNRP